MDVLDRIERGEIDVLVGVKRKPPHYYATPDNNEPLIRYGDEEGQKARTELLRLAKLGRAAERAVQNGGKVSVVNGIYHWECTTASSPTTIDQLCNPCAWQDFCKLREVSP